MKKKIKHLAVDEDVHNTIKASASLNNMKIGDYMRKISEKCEDELDKSGKKWRFL